ncbi:MAG: LysM peptidoglycan-binding domain-containing protein [Verrucomicrobiae bacterium]|nr:LysM peptidoglycan-binding domain-containing protein [Verrucomicrobiae bacterium]
MDSRIWKVIVAVAALHVLVLGSMFLIQHGCKKTTPQVAKPELAPPLDATAMAPVAPPPGGVAQLPLSAYPPSTPVPAPAAPVPAAPEVKTYTIKKGDTLGQVAKLEGVSVSDLTSANPGVDPKKLKIGQEIHVPAAGGSAPSATTETGHGAATSGTYTVKKGDTLAKVAKAQGTTVAALKKANSLSTDTIRVGQKLKIPTPGESGQRASLGSKPVTKKETTSGTVVEASGTTHIVQPGETPAIIAKKYGVTTEALLAANGNPDPRKLKIGQKLTIPGKAGEAVPATAPAPEAAPVDTGAPAGTPAPTDSTTGAVSGSAVAPPPSTPAETPAPSPAPAAPPATR